MIAVHRVRLDQQRLEHPLGRARPPEQILQRQRALGDVGRVFEQADVARAPAPARRSGSPARTGSSRASPPAPGPAAGNSTRSSIPPGSCQDLLGQVVVHVLGVVPAAARRTSATSSTRRRAELAHLQRHQRRATCPLRSSSSAAARPSTVARSRNRPLAPGPERDVRPGQGRLDGFADHGANRSITWPVVGLMRLDRHGRRCVATRRHVNN